MNLRLAIIVSCLIGFVSISMEIIWISVIGYIFKSHAGVFALVLSLVLFGIAFGARYGYKRIKLEKKNIVNIIANFLLIGGIINFLGLPIIGWLMTIHESFGVLLIGKIVFISFLLGSIFPLLCHISISANEQSVGQQASWIYAGNIIGATTGPLITGFVLIDYFDMQSIITGLCVICVLLSLVVRLSKEDFNIKYIIVKILTVILALLVYRPLYANYLELIHFREDYNRDISFKYIYQDKSGIITVEEDSHNGDIIYGGGAYDGRMNVGPENNSNGIDRAYMVAALHPNPSRVLMIGLSTGSWAKILVDYSKIKDFKIVEINSKYIELIKEYPENATIFKDKRVEIIIDDGRRWLKKNPLEKFDMIVMNTTYHFREHITNLLSLEFLQMCKKNLNKGGVMYWNTTQSNDIVFTAAHVFQYVTKYRSFVAASDKPFNLSIEEKRNSFLHFFRGNQQIFTENTDRINLLNKFSSTSLLNIRDSILQENLWLITDDNMATEYKAGIWDKK